MDKRTVPLFLLTYNTKSRHPTLCASAARQFKHHFNAGVIGKNVGVPAPMAWFPFTGWNSSFFGDLHIQGTESVQFYTQQKMTITRWFESPKESHHDPVWKTGKG
jgi:malonate-semialdehyde dehydrogenase (acetylating) / methylmalonate-semialdehyde dehydrogenase